MDKILRITGNGRALCKPDAVVISITIKKGSPDYLMAMQNADSAVMSLKDSLVKAGVLEETIFTKAFDVAVKNKYIKQNDESKYVFDKYEVLHQLEVTIDFDKNLLSKCLVAITDSQSEPVFEINFTVKDQSAAKEQALKNAVIDAQSQAEIISSASGVKLGEIVRIDHSFSQINIARPKAIELARSTVYDNAFNSINVDNIQFEANVTMEWEIDD